MLQMVLAYLIPGALITMLPGPDTAMVLATTYRAGRAAAMRAALGVGIGLVGWGAAAALGLAAALQASAAVYSVFKIVCIAYLLYLAFAAYRAARRVDPSAPAAVPGSEPEPERRKRMGWGFKRAVVTCLLNPKLGVFFVVFLPQFIPADVPVAKASLTLAGVQAVEAVLWYVLMAFLAARAVRTLQSPRVRAWLDRVTGTIFLAFGLRLMLDELS